MTFRRELTLAWVAGLVAALVVAAVIEFGGPTLLGVGLGHRNNQK